jgi:hypothetical protein
MNQDMFVEYQPYIFLAIGLIVLAISVFWVSEKSKLKQTGILVKGIVFEQGVDKNYNHSFDNSSVKDKIVIRFVTQNQESITGIIKQYFAIFYTRQYKTGETVEVYYDKDNPSNFYVDSKQSDFLGRLIGSLAGLIFVLFALYKIFL